jgi:hypothetical protein
MLEGSTREATALSSGPGPLAVKIVGCLSVFAIAILRGSGSLAAISAAPALISAGFSCMWVWLQRRHVQLQGIESTGGTHKGESSPEHGRGNVPKAPGGLALLLRHPGVTTMVALCGLGGPALAAYAIVDFPLSSGIGSLLLGLGSVGFVASIGLCVLLPSVYLSQDDLALLTQTQPGSLGWGYSMSAALRVLVERSTPSAQKVRLRSAGYVLICAAGMELWQRGPNTLEQILKIDRITVDSVSVGDASYGYQSQRAVIVRIRLDSGEINTLPILVRGKTGNWRTWAQSPEQFIQAWRSSQD